MPLLLFAIKNPCRNMIQRHIGTLRPRYFLITLALFIALASVTTAQEKKKVAKKEKRAKPPVFKPEDLKGIIFESPAEAIQGERPSLFDLFARSSDAKPAEPKAAAKPSTADPAAPSPAGSADSGFTQLISPASLEDEIKRIKLEFDNSVSTPAAFKGGDYQKARLHLTTLASLFAVIVEHQGEVRWKKDAAAARDLLARSAANCKSGSLQVFNETKLRRNDLDDLVSGGGLASREAEQTNDWSLIADRVPLMQYGEYLVENPIKDSSQNEGTIKAEGDKLRRAAELTAVLGQILKTEGLPDADDKEYATLCDELIAASVAVKGALDRGDAAAVGTAVGGIQQACNKCHENYR